MLIANKNYPEYLTNSDCLSLVFMAWWLYLIHGGSAEIWENLQRALAFVEKMKGNCFFTCHTTLQNSDLSTRDGYYFCWLSGGEALLDIFPLLMFQDKYWQRISQVTTRPAWSKRITQRQLACYRHR
ncbi:hypothetical protein F4823DRAFT_496735 [Ustulina deusta]|nr:hypothetical protein F4823DRAFT_496735 [Ustulina deusta]